jgi:hypothetical protein
MHLVGAVMMNDDEIGDFTVYGDNVLITLTKPMVGVNNVWDVLEFACNQGLTVSLQLRPAYGPAD